MTDPGTPDTGTADTGTADTGTADTGTADTALTISGLSQHFPLERGLLDQLRRRERAVLRAVDGVDLVVRRGETVGLVGESGCGKSTLSRCVVGLYEPTAGSVRIGEQDVTAHRTREQRRAVQMVFQDPYSSLNPRMSVGQMLRELLRLHRMVPAARVEDRCRELMGLVGLPEHALASYPKQFSGGQRQRVGIARALALEPQVLVADEPVSALDVSVQANVLNLLAELKRELGLSMLFVAHNMAVVRQVCDRVAVMYLGRIVETGATEDVFTRPQHPYTRLLLDSVPRMHGGHEPAAPAAGEPASAVDIPPGCRFASRCPAVFDRCRTDDPSLIAGGGDGQLAACHLLDPREEPARV